MNTSDHALICITFVIISDAWYINNSFLFLLGVMEGDSSVSALYLLHECLIPIIIILVSRSILYCVCFSVPRW